MAVGASGEQQLQVSAEADALLERVLRVQIGLHRAYLLHREVQSLVLHLVHIPRPTLVPPASAASPRPSLLLTWS